MSIEIEVVAAGPPGPRGYTGNTGPKGDKGDKGDTGDLANLDIGTVTTGSPAAAHIDGNFEDGYELDLTLPPGITPALTIGTVDTGAAAATITGTDEEPVLNLTLPPVGDSSVAPTALVRRIGNLLTENQASGGDALGDLTDFISQHSGNGVTLEYTTDHKSHGAGSVTLELSDTGAWYNLILAPDVSYVTCPVTAGMPYTFNVAIKTLSGSRTWRLYIGWYNASGTNLSNSQTSNMVIGSSFTTVQAIGTAPATATYCRLYLLTTAEGSVGDKIAVDDFGFWIGEGGLWAPPGQPIIGVGPLARSGVGSPEGVVSAPVGSQYVDDSGTVFTKVTGVEDTGWQAFATQPPFTPRVILPTDISAVVGDTLQLFRTGIIECANPYTVPTQMICDKGIDLPRMFEWTPEAADSGTTQELTVQVQGVDQSTVATATTNIVVKTAANPATMKRIMVIGDSITNGMAWPEECYRRLTQTGGTPAGKGFANYEFIGDQAFPNFATQGGFGHPGWRWQDYTDSGSPFWIGGAFTVKGWVDANAGGTAPDLVICLLGWNQMFGEPDASGHAYTVTAGKVLVDKIHAEYPSAKVLLIGLQAPPYDTGVAFGAAAAGTPWHFYDTLRAANGRNLAYQAWAAEAGYSSFMRYASLAAQFDAEHNYDTNATPVNTRSAVTELRGWDSIHPGTPGKLQIADVAYREIVRTFN